MKFNELYKDIINTYTESVNELVNEGVPKIAPTAGDEKDKDEEGISGEDLDDFHIALDEIIHKYLGHSSEESDQVEDAEHEDGDSIRIRVETERHNHRGGVISRGVSTFKTMEDLNEVLPRMKELYHRILVDGKELGEDEEDQDEFSFMDKPKSDTSHRDIDRDVERRSLGELIRIHGEDNVRRYFDMEYRDERGLRESMDEDAEGKIDKDRMACNKPRRTSGGSKKFVVKACKDGKEKIVRYGDPNMKIKKSNPKRRKSFRARHKCDQKKDKFSAGYWACKAW